jgi:hypothetical protein
MASNYLSRSPRANSSFAWSECRLTVAMAGNEQLISQSFQQPSKQALGIEHVESWTGYPIELGKLTSLA